MKRCMSRPDNELGAIRICTTASASRRGAKLRRRGRALIGTTAVLMLVCGLLATVFDRSSAVPAQAVGGTKEIQFSDNQVLLELALGLEDHEPTEWDGQIRVEPGQVLYVQNRATGTMLSGSQWKARSTAQSPPKKKKKQPTTIVPVQLRIALDAPDNAQVTISTAAGKLSFQIREIALTNAMSFLDGAVRVARVTTFVQLTDTPTHDDFPTTAVAADGTVWCAYLAYHTGTPIDESETAAGRFESLRTRGNGDQIRLLAFADGKWSRPMDVTDRGLDVWRPSVAVVGESVWIIWSQQVDGNWDLYARRMNNQRRTFEPTRRLTEDVGANINVVATSSRGEVWIAWQVGSDGTFDICLAKLSDDGRLESKRQVSTSPANDWHPAIASSATGDVWVAWDTYHKGDYDVYVRGARAGKLDDPMPIATSNRFEARPALAVDGDNRLWIAFEDADANWGKDYGPRLTGKGFPFYYERNIVVRCLDGDRLMQSKANPEAPLIATHYDDTRYKTEFKRRMSMPRLSVDGTGNLWLLYRRHPVPENPNGERWVSFAQYYSGDRWSGEIPLRDSDNLLDNRPALAPLANRGLLAVYSTDGRTSGSRSAQVNNLNAAMLTTDGRTSAPVLIVAAPAGNGLQIPSVDSQEAENVRRCREYRIKAGGKTYQLLRGEFHRHTEISAHRDWDGPLEEVWRYGLDVAAMDWIGPGDHDYGVGLEYMWWLTQKQSDLYYVPERFLSMYTYERSVQYPSGHRNVMFAERGVRPLPHLPGRDNTFGTPVDGAPDIHNLYKYLKYFGGICSSHTSATGMGTDWRDSDAEVEPIVEIFQGHRQNYEETNAPLAARNEQDSIQGYRPAGFVWEAFKKGIRLGFQSSSDHVSTHTSYAIVLAEQPTRRGIIEAFKKRHSYAANDNIIMDVRCGDHIMGDEFTWIQQPMLDIRVIGTAPIARLDIVRQVGAEVPSYVYNIEPNENSVQFRWTDSAAKPGLNMYYVRIQQTDQRLAWASPMWIHYKP